MTSSQDIDQLADLIDFLGDKRPNVKLQALDIILGLTATPDGVDKLKGKSSKLLMLSLRLVCDPDLEVSNKVLTVLVNLSQDDEFAVALRKLNAIGRFMDFLRDGSCAHPRLLIMLLSNLTVSEEGCSDLLQLGNDKLEGLHMAILLKRFVMSGVMFEPGQEDPYEHVAPILTNVTRFKRAREILLQPGRGTLQALAAQLKAPQQLRRHGVAGAIRNCCFAAEVDGTLASVVDDPAVLLCLLSPISGTEEVPPAGGASPVVPTTTAKTAPASAPQQPEGDVHVRECCAESIMMLAATEAGRMALWKVNAPELLRKGYEYELAPGVCRALEAAAEHFITHQNEDGMGILDGSEEFKDGAGEAGSAVVAELA